MLAALIAASEWLVRATLLRHLGPALLVIALTAVVANVGVIPTYGPSTPIYRAIFEHVAPLGIFWLLLQVNLHDVLRAGAPLLSLFLIGAAGTTAGAVAGMWLAGGSAVFGGSAAALGGMFVGTYTGGSVNFNAVALEYGIVENGVLYAGAAAVDNVMTTAWMAATVALPRLLAPIWPRLRRLPPGATAVDPAAHAEEDSERVHPLDVALLVALGAFAVWASRGISGRLAAAGVSIPSMLVLTTVALLLAQLPPVRRLRGTRLLGLLAIYVFLAVIGTLCDLAALRQIGDLAPSLGILVAVIVGVHAAVVFGAAALLRLDPASAAVASQANIGGSTSALALARSLGRGDLVLPAILVGSVGTAIGNYLGFLTAAWLT